MTTMRWLALTVAVLVGFGAGVVAQRSTTGVSMQGIVMDANTLAEEIEYWELRSASGESVVITGRKDLPIIRWLHQAKGRRALLSIEPPQQASNSR
jgi:hypothetical protein